MSAALDVFVRDGYASASLDDIATAAPASRQTVYNQFGDKQGLLIAVVDREVKATLDGLRNATEGFPDSPIDTEQHLLGVAQRVHDRFANPRTVALRVLVQSEAPRMPKLRQLWRERSSTPVWSALIGQLARLDHAGSLQIEDPARAAGQFVALVTGTTWQMTEYGTFAVAESSQAPKELEQALRSSVRLFIRGYAPAGTRHPSGHH